MGSMDSSSKQSSPTVPPWLLPLLKGEESQYMGALSGGLPGFEQLYGGMPQMITPGVTHGQQQDITSLQNIAAGNPLTQQQQEAAREYESFLGTAGQPSSATQAALKEFQDLQAPQISQQAELMGQGNSGAALAAQAQGFEQAMVPFMQSDLQNQMSAAGGLESIGQAGSMQEQQNLENALAAAGLKYDVNNQNAQNLFNRQMAQEQFASGIQTQPFGLLGSSIGGGTTLNSSPKF